jgi:regulator of nucleoside diphosphate kinase
MKPILSISDYTTLRELIKNLPPHQRTKEILPLHEELDKATIVEDSILEEDIIRINSDVEVEEKISGKKFRFTLVIPTKADIRTNKISVLAPMGIALIGFREGNEIEWNMPSGVKHLRIIRVGSA